MECTLLHRFVSFISISVRIAVRSGFGSGLWLWLVLGLDLRLQLESARILIWRYSAIGSRERIPYLTLQISHAFGDYCFQSLPLNCKLLLPWFTCILHFTSSYKTHSSRVSINRAQSHWHTGPSSSLAVCRCTVYIDYSSIVILQVSELMWILNYITWDLSCWM